MAVPGLRKIRGRRQPASAMNNVEGGEQPIPHSAEDGYLEGWNARIEVRDGRATLTLTLGGFQQEDAPLEVAREAVRFWAGRLG